MSEEGTDASLPTYEKAILQTVAYKRIRETVNIVLKDAHLNTTQWMILGILNDNQVGQKTSSIAHVLQVEVPLITTLAQQLLKQGYIEQTFDARDRRSKPLTLTIDGQNLLKHVEEKLAAGMKSLEVDISADELANYFRTLRTFITNAEKAAQARRDAV